MKKLIKYSIPLFSLLAISTAKSQVLFNEDFDSYPAGHLNTDYTNTMPGQGGWYVSKGSNNPNGGAIVVAETGRGNVLSMATSNNSNPSLVQAVNFRQPLGSISWNSRTAGNDICKFEFEVYTDGNFITGGGIGGTNTFGSSGFAGISFRSVLNDIIATHQYAESGGFQPITIQNYNNAVFPYKMWIKVEVFIDYNTKDAYYYIPTLNLQKTAKFTHTKVPEAISFGTGNLNSASVVKYDNIKLSALQTLPSYILSANEQLATKFNLYPNPATSVVNITNAENMLVNQVTVYDIAGKQLSIQTYNNETEIQLNVEHLASGTYMLHLQTNEGTAVKKLVKK